jgi:RNA polymerase sigma factor (sigma-70 family)
MHFIKALCVLLAMNNSPQQIRKLSSDNLKLVYYFAKPYVKRHKMTYDEKQELYNEGAIGLGNAAKKYDHNKGVKFSTYSSYWIKSYLQKYMKKYYKHSNITHLNENLMKYEDREELDLRFLNDYQMDILISYYVKRETQISISKRYSVKTHRIQKDLKETIEKIREEYQVMNS